jgi:potassium-transporting ATPase KdpC subunit
MNLKQNVIVAALMTLVTTVLLGIAYPLAITGVAEVIFPEKARGQIVERDGRPVGSRLIGQRFTSPVYFHGRPSAAGDGYDAANSGATNLGPTNRKLLAAVRQSVAAARQENPSEPVPVDLVTSSASGLDPHISPASAYFQVARVARARSASVDEVRRLVDRFVEPRQFGILGELRVNVLLLNLALDEQFPLAPPR